MRCYRIVWLPLIKSSGFATVSAQAAEVVAMADGRPRLEDTAARRRCRVWRGVDGNRGIGKPGGKTEYTGWEPQGRCIISIPG